MADAIPKTMRAFVLTGHGGMDKMEWREDWPVPQPKEGEALVRVLACGLNNTDVNTRTGWYSPNVQGGTGAQTAESGADDGAWGGKPVAFPRVQGADVCGVVVAGGGGLHGRRVLADGWQRDWDDPRNRAKCGYLGSERDGGFAEYCALPVRNLHAVGGAGEKMSAAELAVYATSGATALNMIRRAGVEAGERVLITGASGGVGGFLVRIVKALGGVAIAMCGREKREVVRGWGADFVLERAPEDLRAALRAETGAGEVSAVADVVGGGLWGDLLSVLEPGGRYVCSGAIAGPSVDFDLRSFYLRDLSLLGATTTPPELFGELAGMIASGKISPMLSATWPLHELKTAQEAFLSKKYPGKLAVIVGEE